MKAKRIPVVVDFSNESHHRSGWVTLHELGDTVVITQSLTRSEQWESDAEQFVYVPKAVLMDFLLGNSRQGQ